MNDVWMKTANIILGRHFWLIHVSSKSHKKTKNTNVKKYTIDLWEQDMYSGIKERDFF